MPHQFCKVHKESYFAMDGKRGCHKCVRDPERVKDHSPEHNTFTAPNGEVYCYDCLAYLPKEVE